VNETTLQAQSEWLEQRLAELGYSGHDFVASNSGTRRTQEKRSMLIRLQKLREGNDKALHFAAHF